VHGIDMAAEIGVSQQQNGEYRARSVSQSVSQ
jgi:hypothetical protein